MIIRYENVYLEKLFEGRPVAGKPKYSSEVIERFKKTILKLQFLENLKDLRKHKGLNFEALKGNYKGIYSVRVDRSNRLILTLARQDKYISMRL